MLQLVLPLNLVPGTSESNLEFVYFCSLKHWVGADTFCWLFLLCCHLISIQEMPYPIICCKNSSDLAEG